MIKTLLPCIERTRTSHVQVRLLKSTYNQTTTWNFLIIFFVPHAEKGSQTLSKLELIDFSYTPFWHLFLIAYIT